MGEVADRRIDVRAAIEEIGLFFYIGYHPFPGKVAVTRSLANDRGYKPNRLHGNDDGSVTIEFLQNNFGFSGAERLQEFSDYFSDLVVPKLVEITDIPVESDETIVPVRLQNTTMGSTGGSSKVRLNRELVVGTMSLFASESGLPDPDALNRAAI